VPRWTRDTKQQPTSHAFPHTPHSSTRTPAPLAPNWIDESPDRGAQATALIVLSSKELMDDVRRAVEGALIEVLGSCRAWDV
jgi:hypothetical protein